MNVSRFSLRTLFASFVLLAPPIAACSSSHGAPPVAEADFNAQYADIVCTGSETCCAIAQYHYDKAACIAEWHRENDRPPPEGLTYNAANAGECIARLRGLMSTCTDPLPGPDLAAFQSYCSYVYTGAKQPGEACATVNDCAASVDGFLTCDAGVCKVTPANHEGDVCFDDSPFSDCGQLTGERGLYCGTDDRCHRKEPVGTPCSSSYACDLQGYCAGGVCEARGGAGVQCSSAMPCARDQHCPMDALGNVHGVCAPKKNAGEACVEGVDVCFDGFCLEGRCSASFFTPAFCAGTPPPAGG